MLGIIRNLVSGFISFLLVPAIVGLVFVISISSVFLNKEDFISTLKENGTFRRISEEVVPSLLVSLGHSEETQTQIPPEVIIKVVENIDKTQLSSDLETVVEAAHDYVTSKKGSFSVIIPVENYVETLSTNLEPEVVRYIDSLAVCTPVQEQKLLQEGSSQNLECRPASKSTAEIVQDLQVPQIVAELKVNSPNALVVTENEIRTDPQTVNLEEVTKKQEKGKSTLQGLREAVSKLNSSISLLFGTAVLLSLLLFIIRLPVFQSGFRWISTALFSATIFPLVFGVLIKLFIKPELFRGMIKGLIGSDSDSKLAASASSLVAENLYSFTNKIAQNLFIYSSLLVISAIVFFAIYFFLHHRNKKAT